MITDETEYATVSEAARLLRVSVPTVWRWIDSGRLPADRVGRRNIRIKRADIDSVITPARGDIMKEREVIHLGHAPPDVDRLVEALIEGQRQILARRKGKRLPSSAKVIRQAREERAARL